MPNSEISAAEPAALQGRPLIQDAKAMKTKVGALRLRLNEPVDSHLAAANGAGAWSVGKVGPRALATAIGSHTVNGLVEAEMLDPESATEQLRVYKNNLGQEPPSGHCILHFLLPDEGELALAAGRLNSHAQLHVWEMAHRIAPPKSFYKAHPEILEACQLCGAVVLDAGTPSTLTTGSINPLAGDFLAHWIQSALEAEETRPRFFFHVLVPARHWDSMIRIHFGADYGI
jgi:hypothetical protein